MTAIDSITPTNQILDADGRDWAWAYVVFKEIPGFPGYLASSAGHIWSQRSRNGRGPFKTVWHRLKQNPASNYLALSIRQGSRDVPRLVHLIVLTTFMGPCPDGKEACHNNGNSRDNRLSNLRWDTKEANGRDVAEHGRLKGSLNPFSKLTEADVLLLRELASRGVPSARLAERFGIGRDYSRSIAKGKSWRHVGGPIL